MSEQERAPTEWPEMNVPGWHALYQQLQADVAELDPYARVSVLEVEPYLHLHVDHADDLVLQQVREACFTAEGASLRTCTVCGKPGQMLPGPDGTLPAACPEHQETAETDRTPTVWPEHVGGPGWHPLYLQLQRDVAALSPHAKVRARSKFGVLDANVVDADPPVLGQIRELCRQVRDVSSRTCEVCGEPGGPARPHRWIWALCPVHAAMPEREMRAEMQRVREDNPYALGPKTFGTWTVTHADGSKSIWILHRNRRELMIGNQHRGIERIDAYPQVGAVAHAVLYGVGPRELVTAAVTSIRYWQREDNRA
ncbi:hypothetical protein DVB88_00845 [Tsukamurella pulmonis]|nr:hypothetical protein DVB88_00845 [Tsukamurella pulmonis]